MILVLLGTQNNSFNRLLQEIEKCIDNKIINEEVIVQAGYTKFESKKMQIFEFISTDKINKLIDSADIIITHGGVGSIIGSIKKGKRVIAVPRLKEYKEHVNNHQIQIVETLDKQGLIKGILKVDELSKAIEIIHSFKPQKYKSNTEKILNIISNYIDNN